MRIFHLTLNMDIILILDYSVSFLAEHAVQKLGVTHIQADVKAIMTEANGNIGRISCADHEDIYGDFH